MNSESIIVRDQHSWDKSVKSCRHYEIYHTWSYHSLNREGEPFLFVFTCGDILVAFPLIKRTIPNTLFYDLTSVYGYAGPVSNKSFTELDEEVITAFVSDFDRILKEEHCITVFSRLSPFSEQLHLLEHICMPRPNGATLYIDLLSTLDEQRKLYHKRLSRQIRKLREMNYVIKEATTLDEIQKFTQMYHENMDRLGARKSYYFDESYFRGLLNDAEFDNKLLLIYEGEELICGAMLLISHTIIRNHLSGTAKNYVHVSPSKLLTDEISLLGRKLGKKIFHLGGGVGGRKDELFRFKSYFSRAEVPDYTWCYIRDEEAYSGLLQNNAAAHSESTYFPAYRPVAN